MNDKPIHEIIEEMNRLAEAWIAEGNFKDEADVQLAQNLRMVIDKWNNRKTKKKDET